MVGSGARPRKKLLPPSYLFFSLLLMIGLHYVLPLVKVLNYPWSLSGCVPLLIGVLLNLVADQAFKRAGTTVKPFVESSALITDGVFRISRHPMYLGMVLILFGIAMLMGTLTPFFVVLLFLLLMQNRFILVEERMLEARFGDHWLIYKTRVRQWL
jgi:protein-S-isoprenylcysteine O-methyltransferase Ste14